MQLVEEEIVTCSICKDLFTDPKTIQCLHTFCKVCLERSIEGYNKLGSTVCCPLCRTPITDDHISTIPTDLNIKRLIEIFTQQKEARKACSSSAEGVACGCGHCKKDFPSVTWCMECQTSLCRDCSEKHSDSAKFSEHKVVTIDEFLKNPLAFLSLVPKLSAQQTVCSNHPQRTLNLCCTTCSCLICPDCTLKDHQGHVLTVCNESPLYEDFQNKHDERISTLSRVFQSMSFSLAHSPSNTNDSTAAHGTAKSQEESTYPLFVGKYDYSTQADDDLAFKKGDLIYIIKDDGNWWYGRIKSSGQEGYVPRNYIERHSLDTER